MGFEVRESRGKSRGRRPAPGASEYLRLMDLGYGSAAACRAVGVTFRTGRRWRNGRAPEAPRAGTRPARSNPPTIFRAVPYPGGKVVAVRKSAESVLDNI